MGSALESNHLVQTLVASLGKSPSLSGPCFCICKVGMLTASHVAGGGTAGEAAGLGLRTPAALPALVFNLRTGSGAESLTLGFQVSFPT